MEPHSLHEQRFSSPAGNVPCREILTHTDSRRCTERCGELAHLLLFNGTNKIPTEPTWGPLRRGLACLIGNNLFEAFMGLVIFSSIILAMIETDRRVHCEDGRSRECPANFTDIKRPNQIILGIYVTELLVRIAIFQGKFHHHRWNIFDAFVVATSIAGEIFGDIVQDALVIRIFRLLRMVRILRLLTVFNELYLMLAGIGSTMRTIFWAVIMLTVVLSLASLVAVEIVHPVNAKLALEGYYEECTRCPIAYSSVSKSMITFFQTLIMGEGISEYFIPLMETDYLAGGFLLLTTATVYLGFSNLILSVIVEKANEARASDAKYQSMMYGRAKKEIKRELTAIWQWTGEAADNNSRVTLSMLQRKFKSCREFRSYFQSMDMDMAFLECCFKVLDPDNRGDCSFEEFAEWVAKIKNTDTNPLVIYTKEVVSQLHDDLTFLRSQVKDLSASQAKTTAWCDARPPEVSPASARPGKVTATEIPHNGHSDDLVSMVRRAFEGPASRHQALEKQFKELSQTIEAELSGIVKRTLDEFGEQSRMELFACSTQLMAGIGAELPVLLACPRPNTARSTTRSSCWKPEPLSPKSPSTDSKASVPSPSAACGISNGHSAQAHSGSPNGSGGASNPGLSNPALAQSQPPFSSTALPLSKHIFT
mmetsp:Transcript_88463/g.245675  ORF Transcript_88463/g.245675 Transcript_88463/m.245675 type:complete len:651 (-) Transcript_88463:137-2089(-)